MTSHFPSSVEPVTRILLSIIPVGDVNKARRASSPFLKALFGADGDLPIIPKTSKMHSFYLPVRLVAPPQRHIFHGYTETPRCLFPVFFSLPRQDRMQLELFFFFPSHESRHPA